MEKYNESTTGEVHNLKVLPEYFRDLLEDIKTFEVRKNDRDYKVNDILILREWNSEKGYTGKWIARKISYILNDTDYCKEGYVIIGIKSDF